MNNKLMSTGCFLNIKSIFVGLVLLTLLLGIKVQPAYAAVVADNSEAEAFCTSSPPGGLGGTISRTATGGGGGGTPQVNCVVDGEYIPISSFIGQDTEDLIALFNSGGGDRDISTGDRSTASDVYERLALGVNILIGIAGLAIVGSIVFAGFQYMTARENSSQVSAAKQRILVSVASLFLLGFGYALLQWLIPGGVFN